MQSLLKLSRGIDAFTRWTGKRLAWLILVAVVISAVNAIVRKTLRHLLQFLARAAMGAVQHRLPAVLAVDAARQRTHPHRHRQQHCCRRRVRNIIDVIGHAFFLIPLCIVMIITGGPFFMRSFEINEQSGNAGGLPQWPAKSLIIIGFAFLLVQGISELIKRIAVMRGLIPDPHASQVHALEAEVEHLVEAIEKR